MKPAVQSRNTLPLYAQVSDLVARDILSGRLLDGDRLPPERDMARDFGVAIGTLRKALADLAEKGMLDRVQGSGNYVRAGGLRDAVYSMFRLERPGGGGLPRADVLDVRAQRKPADLPAFGRTARATRIRRLRHLDDTPAAVEEIWLEADQGSVEADALSDSLYYYYRTRLGVWITRAEDRVSVAPVPEWAPAAFAPAAGAIVGFVQRLSWADGPVPVEYSRTWFDPDRAHYVQRLK